MSAPISFGPKQAMPFDTKLFEIIGADETVGIAEHEMTLLPPFAPDSVIHDAACGLGPVTQSILATSPPTTIQILATDLAPPMVGMYNNIAMGKNWPSKAAIMDAQNVTFPRQHILPHFLVFRPTYSRESYNRV